MLLVQLFNKFIIRNLYYMFKPVSIVCLFVILFGYTQTYAQGENNIWCFGEHQGLDFNAGPPVLYPSAVTTFKAAASVCDASGGMLFYSGSQSAYDRNNVMMPNSNSLTGNSSATQGAAIAQSFTNPSQFYLCTISSTHKLYYSVVDMSLNFGLGNVVVGQKNILVDSLISEKMIVIRGIDCIWLLVHKQIGRAHV